RVHQPRVGRGVLRQESGRAEPRAGDLRRRGGVRGRAAPLPIPQVLQAILVRVVQHVRREEVMVVAHFIDVGQGNMTLVEMPDGTIFLYDCNVTDENAERVLGYLSASLRGRRFFFVNSHREADHMRGIKRVDRMSPIAMVCDNGEPGGTTDCAEYNEY